jgi:glycosyltransferase involved in cell wall biosynthesis
MADFIEDTIRSVIGQGYPNLQYIVVDGGSTDGTVEIVNRYRDSIDVLISEKDDGQYHAIQKGLALATGEIHAWLNADDIYFPWTFKTVAALFSQFETVDWIMGLNTYLNDRGHVTAIHSLAPSIPQTFIKNGWCRDHLAGYLQQESMFWRRRLWERVGGLDLSYRFAADFKLWTMFATYADLVTVGTPLASFRVRPNQQRSSKDKVAYVDEVNRAIRDFQSPPALWDALASCGLVARSLCRLAIWGKSRMIGYDQVLGTWKLLESRRPLSKVSLTELRTIRALCT